MEIYHGSERIICAPKINGGRCDNDFGQGFYCTESAEMAMEWACKDTTHNAFVNKYRLGAEELSIINLTDPEYNIMNWLALLLEFRNAGRASDSLSFERKYIRDHFLPDVADYDVIIGYRVDDSYFSIARAFLNNSIPLRVLSRAMHLGKLGEQICLKSQKAFDSLLFLGYLPVPYEEYYAKKMKRDGEARCSFRYLCEEEIKSDDLWLIDMLRFKIENDDPRLF